jgi:hypothetical protein
MRRRRLLVIPLMSMVFFSSVFSHAQQLWSGIIAPSRAVNWSGAGISGGLPDASWTQCGSTIAPYSGSATAINNAIANCGANHYVLLGTGTFNLSSGIDFNQHSNVVVRGQGANSTFLVFTGAGAGGYNSVVAMEASVSGVGFENNVCDWTGGYSAGTTTITLSHCGSTTPSAGSLSNLQVGSVLILDQLDQSFDNGTIWNCFQTYTSNPNNFGVCSSEGQGDGNGGFARTDGTCSSGQCHRSQQQAVVVTNISGSTITISPGLYMPNWAGGQLPQAWWATTTATNMGLENLSIDNTHDGAQGPGNGQTVNIQGCYQCWVSGIRSIYAERSHVRIGTSSHILIQNNYFYENLSHGTVSYGAELNSTADSAIINNIIQQSTDSSPSCTGACEGNVIAFNFDINSVYTAAGWMQPTFYQHSSGDALNLWEGNIGPAYNADSIHGTHHFETLFRNYLAGWQMNCDGSPCSSQTSAVLLGAGSRYLNLVGNVLGQSSYHTSYQCLSSPTCSPGNPSDGSIYGLQSVGGVGNSPQISQVNGYCLQPSCTNHGDYDPQVISYLMRWGNYDVVTSAARWCGNSSDSGWSTTCSGTSEVPTGIASYSNPVPSYGDIGAGQSGMPASFYYNTKPSWWQGEPWPPIGPDASGGNIGICSGGTFKGAYATNSSQCTGGNLVTTVAGHANSTPALDCYLNTMGGAPDGSGSVLTFNANSCYGSSSAPQPPTGLTAIVH